MPRWDVRFDLRVNSSAPEFIEALVSIKAISMMIRDIPVPPAVQERLHSLNILRAVKGTTGIEGIELTADEVESVIRAERGETVLSANRRREEREVKNAHDLMRFVESILKDDPRRPLSEGLICQFNRILTEGVGYPDHVPGRYRERNVTAGDYLAPDYTDIARLMREFIEWINRSLQYGFDPIVQAIVAHFLLVSIHPFADGNGRTSRAVESFLLYRAGINVRGFYSLANFYYQNRADYIAHLDHARFQTSPDVTPLVMFALNGMVAELEELREELVTNIQFIFFRDFARARFWEEGRLGTATGVRQYLLLLEIGEDAGSMSDIRNRRHSSAWLYDDLGPRTISRDLNVLRSMGLVLIQDGMVKANTEIMDTFTASNAPNLS